MNGKRSINPVTVILIDGREAAHRLSISPRTLWQLTKDRIVPSIKIGKCVRYRVADLEDWIRRQIEKGAFHGQRQQ